jgi:hypothetical protein
MCHRTPKQKKRKKKITEFTRRTKKESEFVSPSMVKRKYKHLALQWNEIVVDLQSMVQAQAN